MPCRNIVEEHSFSAIAVKVYGSTRDADGQLHAVTWALARETSFSRYHYLGTVPIDGAALPVYIIEVDGHGGHPPVSVYFAVSACDTKVHLLDLLPHGGASTGPASSSRLRPLRAGMP